MNRYRGWVPLLAALSISVGACGDLAGPGLEQGEVRVVAIGDGSAPPAQTQGGPRGTISFTAEVTLLSPSGEPVRLTTTAAAANVRIEGTDVATLAVRRIPTGTYSTLRVVFTNVSANVESGLLVGGLPFLGPLTVSPDAAGSIVFETPIHLEVEPTFQSQVAIDLRAGDWLPSTDLLTRSVPASTFRSAISVRIE